MNEVDLRAQGATIFLRAASYIRRYGWQEKGMGIYGQPRCSMGALASAQPGRWDSRLASLTYDTLKQELHGLSLTQFNHRTQSGEAVAKLYEQVAETLARTGPRPHLQSVNKPLE
ncbi:MAG TPA: hypothetical protein VFX84_03910 [Candidatus Saccharimonadales bacterium]|nr:hypothetical protein [Candidatus Saccharimonadales bacterium]